MLSLKVNFIEAEVARIDPLERKVIITHGEVEGSLPYDYLIFALGRRLATERITGFYEHAQHLLTVDKALLFGGAINRFHEGQAVIGQCPGARLPVPVYETAFALSRLLEERGERKRARITVVSPESPGREFGDNNVAAGLKFALDKHGIDLLPDFPIERVTFGAAYNHLGQAVKFNLVMLLPPFEGHSAASHLGITNNESYIDVDSSMRATGIDRMYAIGDCVSYSGPKLGHMAVRQGEVAAANLAAEIHGREPVSSYIHNLRLVIDEGGSDSIYVHKDTWLNGPATVRQGRFWSWAKRAHEMHWESAHS